MITIDEAKLKVYISVSNKQSRQRWSLKNLHFLVNKFTTQSSHLSFQIEQSLIRLKYESLTSSKHAIVHRFNTS